MDAGSRTEESLGALQRSQQQAAVRASAESRPLRGLAESGGQGLMHECIALTNPLIVERGMGHGVSEGGWSQQFASIVQLCLLAFALVRLSCGSAVPMQASIWYSLIFCSL